MSDIWASIFGPGEDEGASTARQRRPDFVRRRIVEPRHWFDMEKLWKHIRSKARGNDEFIVVDITGKGLDESMAAVETAAYFGKQRDVSGLDHLAAWEMVLIPFLNSLEESMNESRPKDMRGKLKFDVSPSKSLALYYVGR